MSSLKKKPGPKPALSAPDVIFVLRSIRVSGRGMCKTPPEMTHRVATTPMPIKGHECVCVYVYVCVCVCVVCLCVYSVCVCVCVCVCVRVYCLCVCLKGLNHSSF